MNYLHMDLKVCEGCGGLWIRAGVEDGVYCRRCATKLAEFPTSRRTKRMHRCVHTRRTAIAGGAQ